MYNDSILSDELQAFNMNKDHQPEIILASVLRQLAASFYDGLLLIAILLIASIFTIPLTQSGIIPQNHPVLSLYYIVICFLYVGGSWVKGGKTLGMRAWRIYIESVSGNRLSWGQALTRFMTGIPAWGLLTLGLIRYSVPENIQQKYFTDWLLLIPAMLILGISMLLLILDHLPVSWRNRISETRVMYRK